MGRISKTYEKQMIILQEYENYLVIERYKNIHIVSSFQHNGLNTGFFTNNIIKFVKDNGALVYDIFYEEIFNFMDIRIIKNNYDIETNGRYREKKGFIRVIYRDSVDNNYTKLIAEKTRIYDGEYV